MIIRTATLKDIEKVLSLGEQIFEIHSKARPDLFEKKPINYEYLKFVIEENNKKIFIAEDNNELVGYCISSIYEVKNHPMFNDMLNINVEDFCVDKNYRKKGVGKKLFENVKNYAKENNVQFIELSVWEFNQNAMEFYKNMGMKIKLNIMEYKV